MFFENIFKSTFFLREIYFNRIPSRFIIYSSFIMSIRNTFMPSKYPSGISWYEVFKYFSSKFEYSDIDGIRLKLDNGWALIRISNTQPVIVCRAEADSNHKLTEYKNMILEKLLSLGVSIDEKF